MSLLKVKFGNRTYLAKYEPYDSVTIDGRKYRIVQIGRQWWMAENLDFKWEGLSIGKSGLSESEPRANYYDNDDITYGINGNKYGLMYNWIAVDYIEQNKATICPGWRVPSSDDFDTLAKSVGGSSIAGTKLKSTTGWYESGNGDDSYGFNALPAGTYWEEYGLANMMSFFWTATSTDSKNAINKYFKYNLSSMTSYSIRKYNQTSVRLCKDATVRIGGRDYPTTRIGNQVWLAANLNWDADGLVEIRTSGTPTTPAAWYYDNNPETYGSNGLLYNWYSCQALQSVLPKGWRIPTKGDFDILVAAVGGPTVAGKTLKATSGWTQGNGSDLYGFSSIPAGNYYGYFNWIGTSNNIWTSEPESASSDRAWTYGCGTYDRIFSDVDYKINGASIRLVKDIK
jgi:uncharacterized protein (TIGR02145 family)